MKNIKEMTKVEYTRRMDRVLDHIQDNLHEDLSLESLSTVACFSQYHFHRIFRGMVGESVKSYVRRLRLERAAGKLKQTDEAVTMLAFDAGFETHESFTRAFRSMFGVSPRDYRHANKGDSITRKLGYWKEISMKVQIVTMENLEVIFVRHIGPYNQCGTAWDTVCQWAAPRGLLQPGVKMLGLSYDDPEVTPPEKIRYDACIEVKSSENLDELEPPVSMKKIPEGRYAMTTHLGSYDGLAATYAQLCGQWLPQNGYEIDSRACIEIYQNSPEDADPEDLITDIYIPLV